MLLFECGDDFAVEDVLVDDQDDVDDDCNGCEESEDGCDDGERVRDGHGRVGCGEDWGLAESGGVCGDVDKFDT